MKIKSPTLKNGLILITFGVCLYSLLQHLGDFAGGINTLMAMLSPILLGFVLAFVLNVLMSGFEKLLVLVPALKKNRKILRSLSLLCTFMMALAIITLVILVITPKLGEAISLLGSAIPKVGSDMVNNVTAFLSEIDASEELINRITGYISNLTSQLLKLVTDSSGAIANYLFGTVMSAVSTAIDVIFAIILSIYILADKERIASFAKRLAKKLLKPQQYTNVIGLSKLTFLTFTNFIRGQLLEAVILGMMCFVGMIIFGFPHAAAVSLLVGVTALIPIFGAWIGGATAAFLVAMADPGKGLMMVVFFVILQQLEGNLIYPRVVGSNIGLPGMLVMIAVIIGQAFFGVGGILILVPLTAVCYKLLREYVNRPKPTLPAGE